MPEPNRTLKISVEAASPLDANAFSLSPALWLDGESAAMTQLRNQIRRVAPYFRTALLTGERGCGEEAAAHILHQLSPRAHQRFLALTPAETELRFGAERLSAGQFPANLAAEGLLYLPHPERLPKAAQVALLRLLRERGSNAPRMVVFAERGLRPLVTAAGFSPELAESLNALRIALPSLRERHEDIPELLTRILHDFATLSGNRPPQLAPDLLEAAAKFPWPGNFNQLYSAATGLMQRADKELPDQVPLTAEDLAAVLGAIPQPAPASRREIHTVRLDDVIQEHIRAVLFACNGNKLRTAEVLGISRSTLYRMLDVQGASAIHPAPLQNFQMAG
jgi:DNA-binding NtrC family response regulator